MKRTLALLGLAGAMLAAVVLAASSGAVSYTPATVLATFFHHNADPTANAVLWSLRFPRVAIAALVGGTLAAAGALMQSLLRNPLVDPYLSGASAGAAFAIAISIAAGVAPGAFPLIAFAASMLVTVLVALLARSGSGIAVERFILAGISLSSLFAGMTTLVILLTPSSSVSLNILAWIGGSLSGFGWTALGWAALYAAIGFGFAAAAVPALNALRLGRRRAEALGIDVERTHVIVVVAASLLTAAAVSVSGIVGFVGLIVPHIARAAVGHDVRWSLAAAVPTGAAVVALADTIARSAAPPLEFPVGILISMLGVPAFLYLATRRARAT